MTPRQQELAIAKACGWTVSEKGWWSHPTLPDNGGAAPEPPDYLYDLNAIHEAEKVLNGQQWESYICHLFNPGSGRPTGYPDGLKPYWDSDFARIHATAAKRAEAFLKTLDLWKE